MKGVKRGQMLIANGKKGAEGNNKLLLGILPLIRIWKLLVNVSKDSVLYDPSTSTFRSRDLLENWFVDLTIGAAKSPIGVWTVSAKVSKGSVLYDPSLSTFGSQDLFINEFVDLPTGVPESQIKAWTTSVNVWKDSILYNASTSTLVSKDSTPWYHSETLKLRGKWLLSEEFIDLLTEPTESLTKAWTTSVKVSKG